MHGTAGCKSQCKMLILEASSGMKIHITVRIQSEGLIKTTVVEENGSELPVEDIAHSRLASEKLR